MKKYLFIILLFLTSNAWATTWYVRDGGGTATQCTGTSNSVYPGTGSGVACAFSHPAWVLGTNDGGQSNPQSPKWTSGDTLYIDGDSDTSPGNQAQYMIGYGMPNSGSHCTGSGVYYQDCSMDSIPAGANSGAETKIIGTGTHQPQLWGTNGLGVGQNGQYAILLATNGNTEIENLEITQHSSCTQIALSDSGADGFPAYCGGSSGAGGNPWAAFGIVMAGTNLTTSNLWVHRLAENDLYFSGNLSNWTSSYDKFTASGQAIDDGPNMTFGGNNTLTNDIFAFGGCLEHYPEPDPSNVKDTTNYVHCADQNNSGLGGGFMMQNNSNAACGNWTASYTQFLFNLKTNWDFLHCNSTGTVNIYRSRSEGSSGESIKMNVANVNVEESQLIGNAPVWTTAPFTAITPKLPIICRGGAIILLAGVAGGTNNFVNNDITGNCIAIFNASYIGGTGTCTGDTINAYNNKILGGASYSNETSVDLMYNAGNDGNGSGSCVSNSNPMILNQYYNSVYNTNNNGQGTCSGTDICSDPKVLFEATTPIASMLGPTAYYSGTSLGDQLYLQSTSPLKSASTTATYTNGSNHDYNGFTPTDSPVDIGAIQYGSTITTSSGPTTGLCSISNQCASGTCSSSGFCTGTPPCTPNWGSCGGCSPTACSSCSGTQTDANECESYPYTRSCTVPATGCSYTCCAGTCCASGYTCTSNTCTAPYVPTTPFTCILSNNVTISGNMTVK